MKFCPNCGAKLSGAPFCKNCQAPVQKMFNDLNREEFAEFLIYKDFEYEKLSNGNIVLIKCKNKNLQTISVPDFIQEIKAGCFANCVNLTDVYFEGTLGVIPNHCFSFCSKLNYIELPQGLTRIEECAFSDCSSLDEITIPRGVTFIGDRAFDNCSALDSVYIPSTVKQIGRDAFLRCTALSSVTADDVESWCATIFGNYCSCPTFYGADVCFEKNEDITVLNLSNVRKIPPFAFANCGDIEKVIFSNFLNEFSPLAFYNCFSLEKLSIIKGDFEGFKVINNCLIRKDTLVFAACGSIVPSNLATVKAGAFCACSCEVEITFDDPSIFLEKGALFGTTPEYLTLPMCDAYSLAELFTLQDIHNSSTTIGEIPKRFKELKITSLPVLKNNAFNGVEEIEKLILPNNLTKIENLALSNFTTSELTIPASVTQLGGWNVEKGVRNIKLANGSPFTYKDGCIIDTANKKLIVAINADKVPSNIKIVGEYAFLGNTKITELNTQGIHHICNRAFADCSNLTKVIIGDTTAVIECDAFYCCTKLNSVIFKEKVWWNVTEKTYDWKTTSFLPKNEKPDYNLSLFKNELKYKRIVKR